MLSVSKMFGTIGLGTLLFAMNGCDGVEEGELAYDLAQSCFAVQPATSEDFLTRNGEDGYQFKALDRGHQDVERFFAKPSGLGSFLLYDRGGQFLGTKHFSVKKLNDPSKATEWEIRKVFVDDDRYNDEFLYSVRSLKKDMRLTVSKNKLRLSPEGDYKPQHAGFRFIPLDQSECRSYPEAELDAIMPSDYVNEDPSDGPVTGFVDFHTHLAFTKTLGTVAMSGDTFHPYGISHALEQCDEIHGEDGKLDLLESQHGNPGNGHVTSGYPQFDYWPNRLTATHITAYYMWIKRAYLNGLRIMVTNVTGNPTYCQLLSVIHLGKASGDCKSDDSVAMQTQYIYDMQDYIDAQEGGPGKGWFRVVTSPAEARKVIGQNKLAIVLGSEYGTLFDCRHDEEGCSDDYIDQKLTEIYDLGIRSVFPIHRFDNAFGGTRPQGGSGGSWMHLTSKLSTGIVDNILDLIRPSKVLFKPIEGNYWDLDYCQGDIRGTSSIKSMRDFIDQDFKFLIDAVAGVPVIGGLAAKLLDFSVLKKLEPLPEYKKFKNGEGACNQKALQPAGANLIEGVMRRGMILEVDHMSYPTLMGTLDLLEQYQYSGVVSSHSWIENRQDVRDRIFGLGGLMAPMNNRALHIAGVIDQYSKEQSEAGYMMGIGIGTDIQGVSTQASADAEYIPSYPFKSWDGRVTFTQPKTGNRSFSFEKEGIAHYGLLAEWVESLRMVDEDRGTNSLDLLMNSAEAYIQMWERAESQSIN